MVPYLDHITSCFVHLFSKYDITKHNKTKQNINMPHVWNLSKKSSDSLVYYQPQAMGTLTFPLPSWSVHILSLGCDCSALVLSLSRAQAMSIEVSREIHERKNGKIILFTAAPPTKSKIIIIILKLCNSYVTWWLWNKTTQPSSLQTISHNFFFNLFVAIF